MQIADLQPPPQLRRSVKGQVLGTRSRSRYKQGVDEHVASYLHFGFPVERSLQRFRELIIHVSSFSVNDVHFGAVKLNKILYYADFLAFYRFGAP